jgi:hypothetical protein
VEWRYSSTHAFTSALDGGEWSASLSGRFTPRETDPGTHWIGGKVVMVMYFEYAIEILATVQNVYFTGGQESVPKKKVCERSYCRVRIHKIFLKAQP